MHATRTTVTLLAGVAGMAVAALSGCVAVQPSPAAPAPAPAPVASSGPAGQDVAPQIVQGPAREALEAAMPDPPTPEPRSTVARHPAGGPAAPTHRHQATSPRPDHVPGQQRRHPAAGMPELGMPELPEVAKAPHSRADVCALGEAYGGWSPRSEQARICRGTYGH
ncbi:hypothetical protein ACIRSU_05320 [Streptomyces sp. NPDC101160]|uniref:hypothetical protein n=1 Tax=Streptomyces sp. NPDC101160 TaxID=3366118 RepID=UPI0037F14F28